MQNIDLTQQIFGLTQPKSSSNSEFRQVFACTCRKIVEKNHCCYCTFFAEDRGHFQPPDQDHGHFLVVGATLRSRHFGRHPTPRDG